MKEYFLIVNLLTIEYFLIIILLVKKSKPYQINELGMEFMNFSSYLNEFLANSFYGPLTLKAILGQFNFLVVQNKKYYSDIVEDFFSSKVILSYIKNIFVFKE